MQDRLEQLETKLAFQEQSIHELSDALIGQQQRIDTLQDQLERLQTRYAEIAQSLPDPSPDQEIPPHY